MPDAVVARYLGDHVRDAAAWRRARALPIEDGLLARVSGSGAAAAASADLWPHFKQGSQENLATVAFACTLRRGYLSVPPAHYTENAAASRRWRLEQLRMSGRTSPWRDPGSGTRSAAMGTECDPLFALLQKRLRRKGYYDDYNEAEREQRLRETRHVEPKEQAEAAPMRVERHSPHSPTVGLYPRQPQQNRCGAPAGIVAPFLPAQNGAASVDVICELLGQELRARRNLFKEAMRALDSMKVEELKDLAFLPGGPAGSP